MREPDGDTGDIDTGDTDAGDIDWDDVVDVICVGTSPGVDAYAAVCAEAGFEVVVAEFPPGGPDPQTRDYLAAMTADLGGGEATDPAAPIRARPVEIRLARTVKLDPDNRLDPFVGERLRLWSAGCLLAPSGVVFTAVPDHVLTPMRTDAGELITAAALPGPELARAPEGVLIEPVYEGGRIAGALIDDGGGSRLVRADHGLAFGVGPVATPAPHPAMALVGRPAGRFARLEPLILEPPAPLRAVKG